ncbi:hypothetical protein KIL84_005905 [Mauremys mutica]|uniref:Uncharacterized protein n=1 Tax=Mauremys mutica TaxID=74926 RepID=A0A9D3XIU5_9SAUR|nr:hypothetical protein KIL84_005905 [Mauremys mutica]
MEFCGHFIYCRRVHRLSLPPVQVEFLRHELCLSVCHPVPFKHMSYCQDPALCISNTRHKVKYSTPRPGLAGFPSPLPKAQTSLLVILHLKHRASQQKCPSPTQNRLAGILFHVQIQAQPSGILGIQISYFQRTLSLKHRQDCQ